MTAALWIWTVTLAVITIAIVPLAIYLLHRTLQAAMAIERYTREALVAGGGIAKNTEAVGALKETIATATSLLEVSQALSARTAEIAEAVQKKG